MPGADDQACRSPLLQQPDRSHVGRAAAPHAPTVIEGPVSSSGDAGIAGPHGNTALRAELTLDPAIGALEPVLQSNARLPAQHAAKPRVVAVATADPLRFRKVMPPADRLARNSGNEVNQLVDRHQTVSAHVQRIAIPRAHQPDDPLHAVAHVTVRAGLLAVAPHFDFATVYGEGDLAADGRRGFLPAALVGTERAIDVVEPHHAGLQTVAFGVLPAQPL